MNALEFIRVKRTKEQILTFLKDPTLPDRLLNILQNQFGITVGVSGCVAGQAVATAIDEALGLTSNLQYSDLDQFCKYTTIPGITHRNSALLPKHFLTLSDTFAFKHYKRWVAETYPNLNNARLQLAYKDKQLLHNFMHSSSKQAARCETALKYLLGSTDVSKSKHSNMTGLMVKEETTPELKQGYPQVFNLVGDDVATVSYRVVGIVDNGPEQSIFYLPTLSEALENTPLIQSTEMNDAFHVISGFDLNCVSVGISLSDAKLVYTSEYVDFLVNRQIKIISSATPIQSVVRAMRKSQEHAGFFNSSYNLEVMRHTLLYAGIEPIGLQMPDSYEKGSFYQKYVAYHKNKLAGKPLKDAREELLQEIETAFKHPRQSSRYALRAQELLVGKKVCSAFTTSSRFNGLSDQNKELLHSVVDLITDKSGQYVFPIVKNMENIQYDCLIDCTQGHAKFNNVDEAVQLQPSFSTHSLSIWQNIDWGLRFKALRPVLQNRVKRLCATIQQNAIAEQQPDQENSNKKQSAYVFQLHVPTTKLFGVESTHIIRYALQGKLPEKLVHLDELPVKTQVAISKTTLSHIYKAQFIEHLFGEHRFSFATMEDMSAYYTFGQKLLDIYEQYSKQYREAAKVLNLSSTRLANETSVFPYLERVWKNTGMAPGQSVYDAVRQFYTSGASDATCLAILPSHINNQNCTTFWNKAQAFTQYQVQYPTGWGLLEKFVDAWLGVGFTYMLREADTSRDSPLKMTTFDFTDPSVQELIESIKKEAFEKHLLDVLELSVKELITGEELVEEGQAMHHCVGGYSHAVAAESSFIIQYRAFAAKIEPTAPDFVGPVLREYTEYRATAEWSKPFMSKTYNPYNPEPISEDSDDPGFSLRQIRAAYNQKPNDLLIDVDNLLRRNKIPVKDITPENTGIEDSFMAKVNEIGQAPQFQIDLNAA